jgi:hypothetical protein
VLGAINWPDTRRLLTAIHASFRTSVDAWRVGLRYRYCVAVRSERRWDARDGINVVRACPDAAVDHVHTLHRELCPQCRCFLHSICAVMAMSNNCFNGTLTLNTHTATVRSRCLSLDPSTPGSTPSLIDVPHQRRLSARLPGDGRVWPNAVNVVLRISDLGHTGLLERAGCDTWPGRGFPRQRDQVRP